MNGIAKRLEGFRRHGLWLAVVMLGLGLSAPAFAGPFRTLGYDVVSQATANANVAYGESIGALYTNPALLSRYPESVGIGVTFAKPDLYINLMSKPKSSEVPITIYSSTIGNVTGQRDLSLPTSELMNKRSDTNVIDPYAYVFFGGTMALGEKMGIKGLRVGSIMVIPIDSLNVAGMTSHHDNEYEQFFSNKVHFTGFGGWGRSIDGLMGLSWAPWDFLSFGISLKIGVSSVATVNIYMPNASVQDYSITNTDAKIKLALKPIIGIQAQPTDYLSLGLVWRYWSYLNLDGGGDMKLWQFKESGGSAEGSFYVPKMARQSFKMALDYEPMELSGSVGFKMAGFTTQSTVTWNMWHFYLDNHHNTPGDAAHFPTSPYYVDPIAANNESRFDFKDTVSVGWNSSYKYEADKDIHGELMLGFSYIPSPVPAQVGRTNYADSTMFCASIGHRLDFKILGEKFGLDLGLQYWHMQQRQVYKDPSLVVDEFPDGVTENISGRPMSEAEGLQTNNPGYPGYTVGGYMVLASLGIRYVF